MLRVCTDGHYKIYIPLVFCVGRPHKAGLAFSYKHKINLLVAAESGKAINEITIIKCKGYFLPMCSPFYCRFIFSYVGVVCGNQKICFLWLNCKRNIVEATGKKRSGI